MTLHTSSTLWKKLGAIFLALLFTFSSACPRHDIETTYGGFDYRYEVEEFLYAVDTASFDIVAAGTAETSAQKHFIYFLSGATCSVGWHYLLDGTAFDGFDELAIR